MTEEDRLLNGVQGLIASAFFAVGRKEVHYNEDESLSVFYKGYKVTVTIKRDITKDLKG